MYCSYTVTVHYSTGTMEDNILAAVCPPLGYESCAKPQGSYYAGTQRGTHCSYCGLCGKRSSCGHGTPHQERTHTAGAHK